MEITLSRVIDAARQRRAAVTAEAAGYVVLLIVQQVAVRPCPVTAELVLLTAAGEVRIEPGPAVSARAVEGELRRLLAALLALSQSAPPALHAAGERGAVGDLAALESELLAALIPLNHAAAGRALARVYRETLRAPRAALAGNDASPVPSSVASPMPGSVAVAARTPLPLAEATPAPGARVVPTPSPVAAASQRTPSPAAPVARVSSPAAPSARVSSPAAPSARVSSPAAPSARVSSPAAPSARVSSPAAPSARVSSPAAPSARVSSPAAPVARVSSPAAPSARVSSPAAPVVRTLAELEIDVDLDVDVASVAAEAPPAQALTPRLPVGQVFEPVVHPLEEEYSPTFAVAGAAPDEDLEPSAQRSDLRELLNGFLAHTRCEERMAADLRRMIGLEPGRGMSGQGADLGR